MSTIIRRLRSELEHVTDPYKRIDLLNRLAIESRDNDLENSMALSRQAKDLSEQLHYDKGVAWSLLNIGYLEDFQGRKSEALKNLESARQMLADLNDAEGLGYAYKYLCWYYWGRGQVNKAMNLMFQGLQLNEGTQTAIEGWALYVIAVFYSDLEEDDLAVDYFQRSIRVFEALEHEHGHGRALNGLATVFKQRGALEEALRLSNEALTIHTGSGYQMGIARSYNDLGSIYAKMGRLEDASRALLQALDLREQAGVRQAVVTTLSELGNVYLKQQDYEKALDVLTRAQAIAEEIDAKPKLIRIHLMLIDAFKATNRPWDALAHYAPCLTLKTTVLEQDAASRIASVEARLTAEKMEKEAEIERLRALQLEKDKDRIETLFGQQVSVEIVSELIARIEREGKETAAEKPTRVDASIMFMDIRNFSTIADARPPEEVIAFQNQVFSPLIEVITAHHGIINQILGDGFMASFGLLTEGDDHCLHAFRAGLAIIEEMNRLGAGDTLGIDRVGIGLHTGEIITGNIGNNIRKQFSIAGRNVVIAARLEQLNKTFGTQFLISRDVYDRVHHERTRLESLGMVSIKGFERPMEVLKVL